MASVKGGYLLLIRAHNPRFYFFFNSSLQYCLQSATDLPSIGGQGRHDMAVATLFSGMRTGLKKMHVVQSAAPHLSSCII